MLFLSLSFLSYSSVDAQRSTLVQCADNLEETNDDFLTYENPTYGIRMQYPSDWKESPPPGEPQSELLIQLKPPTEEAYFAIFLYDVNPGTTPEENTDMNIIGLQEQYQIVESGPTTLAQNNPAYFAVYDNIENGKRSLALWTLVNNKEYWIEYGALPQAYETFFLIAEQMINSLEIDKTSDGGGGQAPVPDFEQAPVPDIEPCGGPSSPIACIEPPT
jgi:eukaryotic-like serine/threonine-protein kinase